MPTLRWISFPVVLGLSACHGAGPPVAPASAVAATVPAIDGISGDSIVEDIRFLASDALQGRRAGSEGCEKAAAYVAQKFAALGLEPVGDDGYLQHFELTVGESLGTDNSLTVERDGTVHESVVERDFIPLSFSASAHAAGSVVFAGYGITAPEASYDDYKDLDATGKIVLLLDGEPRESSDKPVFGDSKPSAWSQPRLKVSTAKEHGAVGVVFVTGIIGHEREDDDLPRLSRSGGDVGVPVVHIRRTVSEEWLRAVGRDMATAQGEIDEKMQGASFDLGFKATLATDVRRERRRTDNVLGAIPGRDPGLAHEVLVIGAHYDHLGLGGEDSLAPNETGQVHHGADDNASGTAAMLALARAFSTSKEGCARTMLFAAWSGEEEGLLGSAHYVQHARFPIAATEAMINLDMVGRLRDNVLYVGGVGTSPAFGPLLENNNRDVGLKLKLMVEGVGPSDHTSFYLAKCPVLFFFTGVHSDYHRPSDVVGMIDPRGIERVTRFVYRVSSDLLRNPKRPEYAATAVPPQGRSGEGRTGYGPAWFGSVPAFGESSGGYLVQAVTDGSPAQAAGVHAGDLIVRFDGKPVSSLEDYMAVLRRKRPGDVVEVVVKRDGNEVTLTATLGKRK
ncbi:MAG: M28 family peptidase [Planctomycetes bacterium]|nr:M28 family peptidase [Planctomycetota bacterium]MBI3843486.1 M28 family peptidase [Planctomycetota bacterium]